MFSNLSLAALGFRLDQPTAVDLAAKHGFGGVDPDLDYLSSLDPGAQREFAASVRDRGLQWGPAGLPIDLTAPAAEFTAQLADLPDKLAVLGNAGVSRVGTWIRPMHDSVSYRRNWVLHVSRIGLVAELLSDHGLRLGLEYIGPKTFWSTERYPFLHSLAEARELIADSGAKNVGLILDTYHWYTADETAADLNGLTDADIVSADINDAPEGRGRDSQYDLDRRLPGSTGVIDLAAFMSALRAADYRGPVKVEPFMKSLVEQPVDDVLDDVVGRLDRAID